MREDVTYVIGFRDNGDVQFCRELKDVDSGKHYEFSDEDRHTAILFVVDALNEEAAILIAAERRAEYLAEKSGIV